MLKINKNENVNENMVECLCAYGTEPVRAAAKQAKAEGRYREFRGRNGIKSAVFLNDGWTLLCPYYPDTYASKFDDVETFIVADPKRAYLRKDMIREITTAPNAGQRRDIATRKEEGKYVCLSRGKKTRYWVFMTSGRVYGLHSIKEGV